jgi:hypothetical protein
VSVGVGVARGAMANLLISQMRGERVEGRPWRAGWKAVMSRSMWGPVVGSRRAHPHDGLAGAVDRDHVDRIKVVERVALHPVGAVDLPAELLVEDPVAQPEQLFQQLRCHAGSAGPSGHHLVRRALR